jgi:nicotinamidase-related amidase
MPRERVGESLCGYRVAPRSMSVALIVADMLNRYEHDDAEPLMGSVREMLGPLEGLIADAEEAEILTIYVNDNYGEWTAGREDLVERALNGPDRSLVEPVVPPDHAPFVVKARHSIFYGTQLEYLLWQEGIRRLIITGQVTEQGILYSALDGYVRHFDVVVVRDAVAHIHEDLADAALRMMERNMRAQVVSASEAIEAARSRESGD